MATRVLILNRQLAFAVKIKQALEQTGLFDVHPFTKADAAFDFLREHPQDVALVDFTLPGRSGAKIIQQLRSIQADLAIVISPQQPEADVAGLNLQGMIDAPFSARDVIPLLEDAVNQETPPSAPPLMHTRQLTDDAAPPSMQTRQLPEDPGIDLSRLTTSDLENEPPARQKFGATKRLEGELNDEPEAPAQTRNLDQPATKPPPRSPAKTRDLDAEGKPATGHTRSLSDEELGTPKFPSTRKLVEPNMPRPRNYGRTRKLDTDEAPQSEQFNTRQFDNPPPTPPEISSLDEVLKSFGFDPPIEEEDTPAVPMQDSDAVRQYLATTDHSEGGDAFDDILEAFDLDSIEASKKQTDEFRGLVRSLQGHEAYTSLPDRQQQTMDFIFTTGMDSVLQEIEKTKTGPLSEKPKNLPEQKKKGKTKPTNFQKLAEDEPPLPTLEENGTVSDLLVGISDRGFRNVLSLLRGDEIEETGSSSEAAAVTGRDMDEAFHDFFGTSSQSLAQDAPARPVEPVPEETPPHHAYNFDNFPAEPVPDEEATVAQVVLQTTLDESQLPAGFSVDRLISDIEDRLAAHRLNIRPLPSWDMDTTAFRAIIDQAEIREPSFLPEELPPGEFIPSEEQPTRASAAVREWMEGYAGEGRANYLDDTIPSEPVVIPKSPLDERMERASDDLLSSIEAEDIPGQAVEPSWVEDEPEAPSAFDLYPEAEPARPAETSRNFGIEHMFDDMVIPVEDEWDEPPAVPEEEAESALDDFFAAEAAYEELDAPIEPSWVENTIHPIPDAPPEMPAAQPEWIDTSDVSWDSPLPDDVPESSGGTWADVEPVGTPSFIEDMYAEEVSAVEASGWTPPEDVRAAVEIEAVAQLSPEEAYIAQLALNLTQVSLELSSEGSILTRGSEIVAFAGHVSQDDALELRDVIHNDWDVGSEGARLRFINLPSSGKDYMLYSIRTVNELVLSMVFAGTTPLRVIRQQGQRLIEALESIPEAAIEQAMAARPAPPEAPASVAITPVEPMPVVAVDDYAYVWLLRDPEQRLSEAVSHAISAGLTTQLNEQRWRIQSLQVDENYVYLLAGVPGDTLPYQIIGELQQRSAEIASTQDQNLTPQNLWADSYLVLTPGRAMSREEIQEFIEFQRMM